MTEYMTTKELADYYKVSKQSVDKWRRAGLKYDKLGARTFRYKLEDAQTFFKNKGSQRAE